MSIVGLPSNHQPEKMFQKSIHRPRKDSGELDVFEAAKYFSGASEIYGYRATKDEERGGSRMSLDMPLRNAQIPLVSKENMIKEKKHKQPSSPGGKLANFLNSLFNQTSSKKKKKSSKSSSSTSSSMKDHEEEISPVWRRKRRSSISHFQTCANSSQIDPKPSAGFRTPPPPPPTYNISEITPTKSSLVMPLNFSKPNSFQKPKWGDQYLKEEKDDGAESDTSDDLFELPNYDIDCFSSSSTGLPVYETTNMDIIKRSTAIST